METGRDEVQEAPGTVSRKWAEAEDERLRDAVASWTDDLIGVIDWPGVVGLLNERAQYVRSASSIRSRWYKLERAREAQARMEREKEARKPKPPRQPPEVMWLVMRCQPVDSIRGTILGTLGGFTPIVEEEPFWFLPVFESHEEAEKWSDNGRYQILPVTPGKATVHG